MAPTPDFWLELWQTWKTSADSKRYKNVDLQEHQKNAEARSPFIRQTVGSYTPPTKPYYSLRSPFGADLSSCANCIVSSSENCHSGCIDCTGPIPEGVSKKAKKLAEQLRDNYGGIILDRVRKDI